MLIRYEESNLKNHQIFTELVSSITYNYFQIHRRFGYEKVVSTFQGCSKLSTDDIDRVFNLYDVVRLIRFFLYSTLLYKSLIFHANFYCYTHDIIVKPVCNTLNILPRWLTVYVRACAPMYVFTSEFGLVWAVNKQ